MSTDGADDHPPDATGDETEPATPVVRPGDLDALEVAALAGARQWTALATWARRDGHDPRSADALRQLATHADDPTAFTWMWHLITDRPTPAKWQGTAAMPEQVAVPEGLLAAVIEEVTAPPSDDAARDTAREAILARQQPTTAGALQLAGAVLAAETTMVAEVREEAARVLGGSDERGARAALLAAAKAAPWPQQAQLLACLRPPLDEGEVAAILTAVEEGRGHLSTNVGANDPHWVRVQHLVAALPAPARLTVLAQDWLDQPGYGALLMTGPVVRAMGADGAEEVGQLLEHAAADQVPEPVAQALLAQLHTLGEPVAVEMAERAHQLLRPERTAAAREHYRDQVRMYRGSLLSGRDHHRRQALNALARMALAEPPPPTGLAELAGLDQDAALIEYADILRPGETSELDVADMSGGQLRRLGAVLGVRLTGNLPHQWEEARQQRQADDPAAATADTVAILEALGGHGGTEEVSGFCDASCAQVLAGLVAVTFSLVPDALVVAALDAGAVSTALVAQAVPGLTAKILGKNSKRWAPSRTLDVIEAIDLDAAVSSVQELAGALNWEAVEISEDLPRAAAALARHPRLLDAAVRTAVRSQNGPQSQAAPLARVRALVDALVADSGEAPTEPSGHPGREQPQDVAELIQILVEAPHDELYEVAGHWLARCAPTAALVDLVIRADDDTTATPSPYHHARTTMATRLCAHVRDGGQNSDTRIEALELAKNLNSAQARATALDLIELSAVPLRRAAATVIADTPPSSSEGDRLTALVTAQRDRTTQQLLERARRRLASGSIGEVLASAGTLLGTHSTFGELDPDICLPHEKQVWQEVFRQRVNQARASSNDTPESRANALVLLADLLAEQAIATHWIASGKAGSAGRAQQIPTRDRNKPQTGQLASEQQLLRELPLVRSWAGMRESRTGHHVPLDGAVPVSVTEQDAEGALIALRRIFEGWVQMMYDFAGQRPPAAVAR